MKSADELNYLINTNDKFQEIVYVTAENIYETTDEDGVDMFGFEGWDGSNHRFIQCNNDHGYQLLNSIEEKIYVEILDKAINASDEEEINHGKVVQIDGYNISYSFFERDFWNYTIEKIEND